MLEQVAESIKQINAIIAKIKPVKMQIEFSSKRS